MTHTPAKPAATSTSFGVSVASLSPEHIGRVRIRRRYLRFAKYGGHNQQSVGIMKTQCRA